MLSLARTLTLAALSVPLASQNGAVSINFRGNGGQNVAGATGVIATPGWNNVNGGGGSGVVLRDDQGADRGTRLTFASASGGFQLNPPATSDAGALFDGQIITNANNGPATVTLTGVPFPSYDVFVYFGHGPSHAGRDVEISIQGASFFFQNENLQLYADPISFRQVTSRTLPGQTGNFVRIAGVTASTLAITLRPGPLGQPRELRHRRPPDRRPRQRHGRRRARRRLGTALVRRPEPGAAGRSRPGPARQRGRVPGRNDPRRPRLGRRRVHRRRRGAAAHRPARSGHRRRRAG
ncbi:MAG: hypothetical protein O3B85_02290 [Planctomycetota bacterium]|nr:hypothetical protein [Planctomycetota bacterium]